MTEKERLTSMYQLLAAEALAQALAADDVVTILDVNQVTMHTADGQDVRFSITATII